MEIIIRKSEIYKEVEKNTSIIASSLSEKDSANFESVWANEYDGDVLDTYWIEGATSVIQLFKRYINNESVTHDLVSYDRDEVLKISAAMPDTFNTFLIGSIATSIKMMLSCNVTSGWLSTHFPDLSQKYEEDAKGYLEDIRAKLFYRSAPTQVRCKDFEKDEEISVEADYFVEKESDNFNFTQYEKCKDNIAQRGNDE